MLFYYGHQHVSINGHGMSTDMNVSSWHSSNFECLLHPWNCLIEYGISTQWFRQLCTAVPCISAEETCYFHVQILFNFTDFHFKIRSPRQQCAWNACALLYIYLIWWWHLQVHAIWLQTHILCFLYCHIFGPKITVSMTYEVTLVPNKCSFF